MKKTIVLLRNGKKIILSVLLLLLPLSCKRGVTVSPVEDVSGAESDVVVLSGEQISMVGITAGPVEQRSMGEAILTSGALRLSPQARAEVTSLVRGSVKKILVKEGQTVHAGQTLSLVENTEIVSLQKEYLLSVRQAELSEAELQRERVLREKGAGVGKNLSEAEARSRMDESTSQGLRQQLLQLGLSPEDAARGDFSITVPVKAPIGGVVGEMFISMGSYLAEGSVLMNIYDNKALHADLNVFEGDISRIMPGQKVSLRLSDSGRTSLEGEVSFITAALDPQSKSATVHVDLRGVPNETMLFPNMFVSAAIQCGERLCNAVPDEALVMKAGRSYVFIQEGEGRFRKVEVVPLSQQLGYTGISFLDPSAQGKSVVTTKAFYLESVLADHGEE